jgi:flotillin
VAEAEGKKAQLLAEAEGTRAKLLAEAEGKEKLAEALKKLNEAGQLLFLMEKSPEVIKALGEAGGEIAKNIFTSLAAPLAGIDKLTVYDSDGPNSSTHRLAAIVPNMFFDFVQQCKAQGLADPAAILTKAVEMLQAKLQEMATRPKDKTTEPTKPEEGQKPKK